MFCNNALTEFLKESSALLARWDKNEKMRLPFGQAVTWGYEPKGLRRESEIKLFIENNQIDLIMESTSFDTKHRYKLILCSIWSLNMIFLLTLPQIKQCERKN